MPFETNLRLLEPPDAVTLPSRLQGNAFRDFSRHFDSCLQQSRGVTDAEIQELLFRMQIAAADFKLGMQRSCDAARGVEAHAEDITSMLDEMLESPDRQIPARRVQALLRRSTKYGEDATQCQSTFENLVKTLDELQRDVREKQRRLEDERRNRSWFQSILHTIGTVIGGLTGLASAVALFLGGPAWSVLSLGVGSGLSGALTAIGRSGGGGDDNQRKSETLQKADTLLGEAIQQVGEFTTWWQEQSTAMEELQEAGDLYLGRGEARRQEAKRIKEKWVDVRQHMAAYKSGLISGDGSGSDTVSVTFVCDATTTPGENIYLVGNVDALQHWNTDNALLMSAANYPNWSIMVTLPASTGIQYKYIRKYKGTVTWESGGNNEFTSPSPGSTIRYDSWRWDPFSFFFSLFR